MLGYIISIVLGAVISLCFFKNRVWENRYLALAIIAGTYLLISLGGNYVLRTQLDTEVLVLNKTPLTHFMVEDNRLDKHSVAKKGSYDVDDIIGYGKGSAHHFFYGEGNSKMIAYAKHDNDKNMTYHCANTIYFASSGSESKAYYCRRRYAYVKKSNTWLSGMSMPNIKTIKCLYLPPSEYALIPESLNNKITF